MQVLAVLPGTAALEREEGREGGRERERVRGEFSEAYLQSPVRRVVFRFNMLLPNGLARDRCYKICVRGRFNVGVLDGEIVSLILTGSHSLDVVRDRNLSLAKDLSWALIVKG